MLKWAIEVNMHVKIDDEMILDVDVWLSMWPINPSIPNIIRAENTKQHVIFSSVYWMCQWKSDRFTKCHLSLELKWIELISLLRKRQRERVQLVSFLNHTKDVLLFLIILNSTTRSIDDFYVCRFDMSFILISKHMFPLTLFRF